MNSQERNETKIMNCLKGVELSEKELKTINWLAKWESDTVESVCSLLEKVKGYGYIKAFEDRAEVMGGRNA